MDLDDDDQQDNSRYPLTLDQPEQLLPYANRAAKSEKDILRGKKEPELIRSTLASIVYYCLSMIYERRGVEFLEGWDMYQQYLVIHAGSELQRAEKNTRRIFGDTQYNILWKEKLVSLVRDNLRADPQQIAQKRNDLASAISDIDRTGTDQANAANQALSITAGDIRRCALLLLNRQTYANPKKYDTRDTQLLFEAMNWFLLQLSYRNTLRAQQNQARQAQQLQGPP